MMILGGLAGMGIFYAVTRSFDEPSGYAIFFGMGAGFPFGWCALSFMDPIINSLRFSFRTKGKVDVPLIFYVMLLFPYFLYIVKFGLAVMVGIPALVFSVVRHLWRVFLD